FITVAVACTFFMSWRPPTPRTSPRSSSAACWPPPSAGIFFAPRHPPLSLPPLGGLSARLRHFHLFNHFDYSKPARPARRTLSPPSLAVARTQQGVASDILRDSWEQFPLLCVGTAA